MTDSTLQNALRDKVAEFAASDDALKEIVARLSELESIITSHRESRKTLDEASKAVSQVVSSLSPIVTESAAAVGEIAKTSSEFGSTLQKLVDEVSTIVADQLEKSRLQIENLAQNLIEQEQRIIESNKASTRKILIVQGLSALGVLAAFLLK